jgi:hypothetical protein
MPSYVIIDTSIYRELGLKFYDNIDYINLSGFTVATDTELLISTIVKEEFLNFYKSSLIKKSQEYVSSINALKRDPHFNTENVSFEEIDNAIEDSLKIFENKISNIPQHNSPFAPLKHTYIDALELTKFILESRNQGVNNIQVRDFLIWDSIIQIAKEESKDRIEKFGKTKVRFEKGRIYFIAKDKIFSENQLFQVRAKKYGLTNIEVFNSIPEFLHKKGFNIPFLTQTLILTRIKDARILKDLSVDVGALLSYINDSYTSKDCDDRKVVLSDIVKKEIIEYYSYKDTIDEKFKFVAHLKVYVNVVFEGSEIDESLPSGSYGLSTYDNEGRPYFNAPILFIYRGLLDVGRGAIKTIQFVDFLPFVYI